MIPVISPAKVRLALLTRSEIALIDLREEQPFSAGHPLFAACLPLSRLEIEILERIPRKNTAIVLYDNGEGLTTPAADRLRMLGYVQLSVLDGGLEGWRAAGYELFTDVNSPSKAFGELVDTRRETPSVSAAELRAMIDSEANIVVLDVRRFDEFQTMSIPTGISVPGAELVLRAPEIASDPNTTIIVNCAGRTRSIIGAQSLINAGLPNPVAALRNGAIGWTLAGLTLEQGQQQRFPSATPFGVEETRRRARSVADRAGVRRLTLQGVAELAQASDRTIYRFDVRIPEEYARGHIGGFRNAPGGQLLQETDVFAAVRGARIVVADDLGARADMTASWLAQMGWEAYVLDDDFPSELEIGSDRPTLPALPNVPSTSPADLAEALKRREVSVIDFALSAQYRKGHIPGAWFAIRARIADAIPLLPRDVPIVLASPDGALARLAAAEVEARSNHPVRVLQGGTAAWLAAGFSLEAGFSRAASPSEDVYQRPYEGVDHPADAKQAYLDWEFGLVDQLARDGTHGFFVI